MPRKTNTDWLKLDLAPEIRFQSFREWLAGQLFDKLEFSENPERRARQIGQAEAIVLQTVTELEQRGFRLDGQRLKAWIEDKLDTIADYQSRNLVDNFFMYFKRSWRAYVEQHAERLKEETKSDTYLEAVKGLKTIPQLAYMAEEARLKGKLLKRQKQAYKQASYEQQQTLF